MKKCLLIGVLLMHSMNIFGWAKNLQPLFMKKLLLIILLLFSISCFAVQYSTLYIWFKDGNYIEHEAKSYWTIFYHHHNFYEYLDMHSKNVVNENYLCFYDSSVMNPASRETKRQDYKDLRDKIQATGNEANYFEDNGRVEDDWCVSIRYDQIDKVVDYYFQSDARGGGVKVLYEDETKRY